MTKLKIKAPVNSLASAKLQLDAGAEELYVGLDSAPGDNLIFSARATRTQDGGKTNVTDADLAEICRLAHARKARVELAANNCFSGSDPDFGTATREQYYRYVKRGIEAGVDGIIVGELGNLLWLRSKGVTTPFTASVHFSTFNRYQIQMLQDLGVSSVVIPHHFKIEEIAALAASSPLKIIAFGHFGCSFIECTCLLLHELSEKKSFGIPCRSRWCLKSTGEKLPITNVAEDCSICMLGKLEQAGVHSIKIVGRELNSQLIANTTRTYAWAIAQFAQGLTTEQVLSNVHRQIPWWKQAFCDPKKCKYMFTDHYI